MVARKDCPLDRWGDEAQLELVPSGNNLVGYLVLYESRPHSRPKASRCYRSFCDRILHTRNSCV